jgi:GNAT superfamily N-acetyltransferase
MLFQNQSVCSENFSFHPIKKTCKIVDITSIQELNQSGFSMKLIQRPYNSEEDAWRIRAFLTEVFLLNQRIEISWPVYRFDYWFNFINPALFKMPLEKIIHFWETSKGEIAAFLIPDNPGEAFFNIHPKYSNAGLLTEMFVVTKNQLRVKQEDGSFKATTWIQEKDIVRQEMAKQLGYKKANFPEFQRRRLISEPIQDVPIPAGYTLRSMGDTSEIPARSWLSWKAFHSDEPDDHYQGWDWYPRVQSAPLYRRDLDLVAVAADGELASFCTLWFDDVTRTASFEPVGTHPNHQKKGVGKALMTEGLKRVKHLGATLATVGSYSVRAGALYESIGFKDYSLSEPWELKWD